MKNLIVAMDSGTYQVTSSDPDCSRGDKVILGSNGCFRKVKTGERPTAVVVNEGSPCGTLEVWDEKKWW